MKKVLALVLAVVLALGLTSVAFAAKVTGVKLGVSGSTPGAAVNKPMVYPGETIKLYLYNGATPITRQDVADSKIAVKIKTTAGGSVLKSAEIKYDSGTNLAYVRVSFVDPYVATKDTDFDYTVYLTYDKVRDTASEVNITGTFGNQLQTVNENDDYVYVNDIPVVEADDYIKKIEVDLGEGVSIFARMFEGKKYYGHVSQEIKTEDEAIVAKYSDIDTVYYLSTIGLNNSGDVVKFDLASNMYVYAQDEAGNLVYIGRSNSLLPYYTKYFLSGKELNVAAADDTDTLPTDDGNTDNASTGGDDVIANVNDNPGTGC